MAVKKNTENRHEIFRENFGNIIRSMTELTKIGVSYKEMSHFLFKWMHQKTIFEEKFFYSMNKKNFVRKSNFPKHFEYYEQYIRNPNFSPQDSLVCSSKVEDKTDTISKK